MIKKITQSFSIALAISVGISLYLGVHGYHFLRALDINEIESFTMILLIELVILNTSRVKISPKFQWAVKLIFLIISVSLPIAGEYLKYSNLNDKLINQSKQIIRPLEAPTGSVLREIEDYQGKIVKIDQEIAKYAKIGDNKVGVYRNNHPLAGKIYTGSDVVTWRQYKKNKIKKKLTKLQNKLDQIKLQNQKALRDYEIKVSILNTTTESLRNQLKQQKLLGSFMSFVFLALGLVNMFYSHAANSSDSDNLLKQTEKKINKLKKTQAKRLKRILSSEQELTKKTAWFKFGRDRP